MVLSAVLVAGAGCGNKLKEDVSSSNVGESIGENEEKSGEKSKDDEPEKQGAEPRQSFILEGQKTENSSAIPIRTIDDLKQIPDRSTETYILMNDIDAEGKSHLVGNFQGIFDGNYHKIENASGPVFTNIFDGTVCNLAVIDTTSPTGGIAEGIWSGTISNCYVTGEIGKDREGIVDYTGGIVAEALSENMEIKHCFSNADIYGGRQGTGGIIGGIQSNTGQERVFTIANCENYGTLYTYSKESTGGICGEISFSTTHVDVKQIGTISRCFNYGAIEETEEDDDRNKGMGGILGDVNITARNENSGIKFEVTACANYGQINKSETTKGKVAGICGKLHIEERDTTSASVNISDCLNAGTEESISGICDQIGMSYGNIKFIRCLNYTKTANPIYQHKDADNWNSEGTVHTENCYYLSGTEGLSEGYAEALVPEQMRDREFFSGKGFELESVWGINKNFSGYLHVLRDDEISSAQANYEEWENQKMDSMISDDSESGIDSIRLKKHYADMLAAIGQGNFWPDDESATRKDYLSEYGHENKFAVYDIDGDGIEELLVEVSSASMADMRFVIYQYDLESNVINVEFDEFITNAFYDNGMIVSDWSHNQGLGNAIMPHTIYQYDKQQDMYVKLAEVDSWNKELAEKDWDGNTFPDLVDKDGDGNVYFISDEEGKIETVDGAKYEKWEESVLAGAKELEFDWKILKYDNYSIFSKAYVKNCLKKLERGKDFDPSDIGYVYMKNDGLQEAVKEILSSEFGIEMQSDEDGFEYTGIHDGKPVIVMYAEDGGGVTYQNVRVENLKMFGLYPGIKVSELEKTLEGYGFEHYKDGYSTGDNSGNFFINYMEEDGIIQKIDVYYGGRYVG